MPKLNQVLAVEKGIKTQSENRFTELYKVAQKPALFDGFVKTYQKSREDEEDQPPQKQLVQFTTGSVLNEIRQALVDLFDVTATKDLANTRALADVVVDGTVIATQVPATFLLFVEKKLTDLNTVVSALPELDPSKEWESVPQALSLSRSKPLLTQRTKKVPKAIVLYPATPEHPAQTQLYNEDIVIGTYEHIAMSGAMDANQKRRILSKIQALQKAVKTAREEANLVEAPPAKVGDAIFGWLFD